MSDQEVLEAVGILEGLFAGSGLDARPEARGRQGGFLDVELVGDDAAAMFGRHGKALDAMQFLCNLVLARQAPGALRILLDAGGYRARRIEQLTALAQELADEVKARQEECEVEPLPPHERRIIHKVLSEDPAVRTYSEGEEPDRRVVIAPA